MIQAIRRLRLPQITYRFHYVEGHKDDDPNRFLAPWEELNVEMDALAKITSTTSRNTTSATRMESITT